MLETLRVAKGIMSRIWTQRTKILVLILVMTLVAPQPAKGQFIDVAAIVAAIGAINTAITNVIGSGLRDINGALNAVDGILNTIQSFLQNTDLPAGRHQPCPGRCWYGSGILQRHSESCKSECRQRNPC